MYVLNKEYIHPTLNALLFVPQELEMYKETADSIGCHLIIIFGQDVSLDWKLTDFAILAGQ